MYARQLAEHYESSAHSGYGSRHQGDPPLPQRRQQTGLKPNELYDDDRERNFFDGKEIFQSLLRMALTASSQMSSQLSSKIFRRASKKRSRRLESGFQTFGRKWTGTKTKWIHNTERVHLARITAHLRTIKCLVFGEALKRRGEVAIMNVMMPIQGS